MEKYKRQDERNHTKQKEIFIKRIFRRLTWCFNKPIARFSNICGRFACCNVMLCLYFFTHTHKRKHMHSLFRSHSVLHALIRFLHPAPLSQLRSMLLIRFLSYKIQFIVRSIEGEINCTIHNISYICVVVFPLCFAMFVLYVNRIVNPETKPLFDRFTWKVL